MARNKCTNDAINHKYFILKVKHIYVDIVDGGSDEAANETVQVPEGVPVTRKRGRPRTRTNKF